MSRDQALVSLNSHPYGDENLLKIDKEFFIKKLELTEDKFNQIMNEEPQSALKYSYSSIKMLDFIYKFQSTIRKLTR